MASYDEPPRWLNSYLAYRDRSHKIALAVCSTPLIRKRWSFLEEPMTADALTVARECVRAWCRTNGLSRHDYSVGDMPDAVVHALSVAGLLVTPLHERALAACKRMSAETPINPTWATMLQPHRDALEIGREALAADQKRTGARYYVGVHGPETDSEGLCYVCEYGKTERSAVGLTHRQAHEVRDTLNRLSGALKDNAEDK